jgi:hypothetical protein
MSDQSLERWEQYVMETARAFTYPPTPDLARTFSELPGAARHRRVGSQRAPRLAWALVALLVLFACLMSVPPVRAQILEFLQVGVIRIFLVEPSPTPSPFPSPVPPTPSTAAPGEAPNPSTTPGSPSLNLLGETTLADASRRVPFEVRLPAYPEDLGEPHRVYLQDLAGEVLVLVWFDPERPGEVKLSLHMYSGGSLTGEKIAPQTVQQAQVGDDPAVWAEGPYILKLRNGSMDVIRLIEGHVLIWESGELTYRLETDLPLQEAVRIAESLQPYTPSEPASP